MYVSSYGLWDIIFGGWDSLNATLMWSNYSCLLQGIFLVSSLFNEKFVAWMVRSSCTTSIIAVTLIWSPFPSRIPERSNMGIGMWWKVIKELRTTSWMHSYYMCILVVYAYLGWCLASSWMWTIIGFSVQFVYFILDYCLVG